MSRLIECRASLPNPSTKFMDGRWSAGGVSWPLGLTVCLPWGRVRGWNRCGLSRRHTGNDTVTQMWKGQRGLHNSLQNEQPAVFFKQHHLLMGNESAEPLSDVGCLQDGCWVPNPAWGEPAASTRFKRRVARQHSQTVELCYFVCRNNNNLPNSFMFVSLQVGGQTSETPVAWIDAWWCLPDSDQENTWNISIACLLLVALGWSHHEPHISIQPCLCILFFHSHIHWLSLQVCGSEPRLRWDTVPCCLCDFPLHGRADKYFRPITFHWSCPELCSRCSRFIVSFHFTVGIGLFTASLKSVALTNQMKHRLQVSSCNVSISGWRWKWFFCLLVWLPKSK